MHLFLAIVLALSGCGDSKGSDPTPDGGMDDADVQADTTPDAPGRDTGDVADLADAGDTPDAPDTADDPDVPDVPDVPPPQTEDYLDEDAGDATEGTARILTYNVAGLPQGISSSNPVEFIPQISPLLNTYDLVLAQEDFWYPEQLRADIDHPYVTVPYRTERPETENVGDGLNRFSRYPFGRFERRAWPRCHGQFDCASDCLASKGFSYARTLLANGVVVDVYNLHMEAGGCTEDLTARAEGVETLIAFALEHSEGQAIVMGGDFNLHVVRDEEDGVLYDHLMTALGLRDACWDVDCGDERIDRFLLRDSDQVALTTTAWSVPREFVSPEGEDLSDHKPIAIELQWRAQ